MGEQLSINQLSVLTGRDRRTIDGRLVGLACQPGPKNAKLYDSEVALAKIYVADSAGKTLDQARTDLAIEQARQARLRGDEIERTRIPIEVVDGLWDRSTQAAAAILKASEGQILSKAKINEILAALAQGERPEKW